MSDRMTLSRLVEILAARSSTGPSSVSLTLNAKGDTQVGVEVKVGEEAPTVGEAAVVAASVYDILRARYPRTDNGAPQPPQDDIAEKRAQIRRLSAQKRKGEK